MANIIVRTPIHARITGEAKIKLSESDYEMISHQILNRWTKHGKEELKEELMEYVITFAKNQVKSLYYIDKIVELEERIKVLESIQKKGLIHLDKNETTPMH